jgi:putative ABC transport system ATP-binding protein
MRTADELIKTFKLTAILITHHLKDAFDYGNRIIQMGEGQILRDLRHEQKLILKKSELFEWFG